MDSNYDLYDFSGVASDLAVLRSQLLTLQIGHQKHNGSSNSSGNRGSAGSRSASNSKSKMNVNGQLFGDATTMEDDDEEWYPPSPPIYDVADKLIEINREHYSDPTSDLHLPSRLRWRPEANLVQIKWLYSDGYSSDDEEDSSGENSSDNAAGGLVAQMAKEMERRLNLSSASSLFPTASAASGSFDLDEVDAATPVNGDTENTCEIEVAELDPDDRVVVTTEAEVHDYNDDDFETFDEEEVNGEKTPSATASPVTSPTKVKYNGAVPNKIRNYEDPRSSSSPESSESSCRTVTTLGKLESNNNNNNSKKNNLALGRQPRPPTKKTVIRTHGGGHPYQPRSSSLPKHFNNNYNSGSGSSSNNNSSSSCSTSVSNQYPNYNNQHQQQRRPPYRNRSSSAGRRGSPPEAVVFTENNGGGRGKTKSSRGATAKVGHATISKVPSSSTSSGSINQRTSAPSFLNGGNGNVKQTKSRLPPDSSSSSSSRDVITIPNGSETRSASATSGGKNYNKSSVYLNGNGVSHKSNVNNHRKTSRNSLSSNSSVSSQTTEESMSADSLINGIRNGRRVVHHRHPGVVADVMSSPDSDSPSFVQWKLRKREEKRLRERRSYLEAQMRRY